jgi:DNA-directed RNA polymerase III subunit RPC2
MPLQADPKFFLRYTNIYVDWPSVNEDMCEKAVSPHECRLRDLSYAAPLYVDVRYTLGNGSVRTKQGVMLGRIPIMLRSSRCWLRGKTMSELEEVKECPYDPGAYTHQCLPLLYRTQWLTDVCGSLCRRLLCRAWY